GETRIDRFIEQVVLIDELLIDLAFRKRQVRRPLIGIVDAACDDRAVGIAVDKIDNHLVADARQKLTAEMSSCPSLRHAHPAGIIASFELVARLLAEFAILREPY